ncbi:hypothetical protein QJQ45_015893, partial [Haematococcus lacustris]
MHLSDAGQLRIAWGCYFLLGIGILAPWNAYISATDFFEVLFPGRHTDRLFTVTYLPSCLLLLLVTLRWRSARWLPGPPARIKLAFLLFTLLMLAVPLSSLAQDSTRERAKRLLAAANAYLKVKRGQPQPSMAAVAREHCVPYATLRRVIKRGGVIAKRERPTALSAVEEEQLRDLVVRGQQQGVGVTKTALLAAVRTTQRVTERKGKVDPFKGEAPGKKWRQGFMRHLVDWLLDRSSSTPAPPTSALPGVAPLPHQPPALAQDPDTPHPAPTPSRDPLRLPSPLAPPPHTPPAAPGGVLAALLSSVLLLGVGDGLAQGAVFGEAAQLPPSFTQA